MATLSYTLYDYANISPAAVTVTPTVTLSHALLTLTTNGPFPTGAPGGNPAGGVLYVTIDGIYIGQLFDEAPGPVAQGYFVPRGDALPYGTAVIPEDVWQSIISDGEVQVEYAFGVTPGRFAEPDDFIRVDVDWYESYNGVRGSPEDDTIVVNMPTIIEGRGGDDDITGSDFRDIIMGGTGDDEVSGGDGNDHVRGDDGSDVLRGDNGIDRVLGGDGDDTLSGGNGDDFLWGEVGNDWLYGDAGTDRLWGGEGDDRLYGGAGNDYLWGGDGNDLLHGGQGDNHLFGGAGQDYFVFNSTDRGTYHIHDFDRSAGEQLFFNLDFDDYADDYDMRVGKDGTVITILDATIILSGVFDFKPADLVFGIGQEWLL